MNARAAAAGAAEFIDTPLAQLELAEAEQAIRLCALSNMVTSCKLLLAAANASSASACDTIFDSWTEYLDAQIASYAREAEREPTSVRDAAAALAVDTGQFSAMELESFRSAVVSDRIANGGKHALQRLMAHAERAVARQLSRLDATSTLRSLAWLPTAREMHTVMSGTVLVRYLAFQDTRLALRERLTTTAAAAA